ncbi:Nn.00g092360.m01.CDS01 [Neocucurbitaria sp. VM-36]
MNYSAYPRIADYNYSPPQDIMSYQDQFDRSYIGNAYTTSPTYSSNTFFDSDPFFDRPLTSVEMQSGFPPKSQGFSNPTLPATGISTTNGTQVFRQPFNPASLGSLEQYPSGFSLNPTSLESNKSAYFSPETQNSSRTPSLCGDAPQQAQSPSLSPHLLKRESPSSPTSISEESTPKRPQRKRGRPRLDRSNTDTQSPASSSSTAKCQRSGRLPHNQVERKYREGLNSELERLRKAVPTLPQSDEAGVMGQPKPSKAMVLSSAIEYIRRIENERDTLREENDRLKMAQGSSGEPKSWRTGEDSLEEFLMDP